jgi:hypothetical protein
MLFKIKDWCIGIALSFCPFILLAQQVNYPPANKVATDFKNC